MLLQNCKYFDDIPRNTEVLGYMLRVFVHDVGSRCSAEVKKLHWMYQTLWTIIWWALRYFALKQNNLPTDGLCFSYGQVATATLNCHVVKDNRWGMKGTYFKWLEWQSVFKNVWGSAVSSSVQLESARSKDSESKSVAACPTLQQLQRSHSHSATVSQNVWKSPSASSLVGSWRALRPERGTTAEDLSWFSKETTLKCQN